MDNPTIFRYPGPFTLESGAKLQGYHLAYHTFGRLNAQKDNTVWVFHALTANSDPTAWWPGLVGEGRLFDPKEYFIVCVNMPGSCYGSVGPLENKPGSDLPYYHDFPFFTIRDMIRSYQPLKEVLGITTIQIGIGGSMGGQQLLEWAVAEPRVFETIIPIATNAWHSPWGKAFNASQRWCIEADPSWTASSPQAGVEGLKVARSIALLSYRNYQTYDLFQSDEEGEHEGHGDPDHPGSPLSPDAPDRRTSRLTDFRAASYQRYQGEKLAARFNAFSYYRLSQSMDSHHLGRHPHPAAGHNTTPPYAASANPAAALHRITAKTLIIGLWSDILFPVSEQQYLATHIPSAKLSIIDSIYGHDGFLLESEAITREVSDFLNNHPPVPDDPS